jgi:hypothetical protein
MKVLIIVLSYDDNDIYTKFYKSQVDTWDSIILDDVSTYYLFGNNNINKILDNKLLVDVKEISISICGYKTLNAFNLIKNMDFDYIFRTNSSSYVDKKLLIEFINSKPKNNYYSGAIGQYDGIQFASGCGYFLSKDLINLVIENVNLWDHNLIDDVALAKLLSRFDVYPQLNQRFDITDNNSIDIANNYFHYRLNTHNREYDISNMYKIFNIKNNKL